MKEGTVTVMIDPVVTNKKNQILSQLLQKPVLKNSIKSFLTSIDPNSGSRLVSTFIWQDPEVMLSILASIPAIANIIIKILDEVLVQVMEKFPSDMLDGYAKSLVDDIDREAFERLKVNYQKFQEVFLKNFLEGITGTTADSNKGVDNG
jgi:hypothetical protein